MESSVVFSSFLIFMVNSHKPQQKLSSHWYIMDEAVMY